MLFRTECRYWRGHKPCPENRLCEGCPAFQSLGPRILIIKLGARGDVLRTTPLVTGLKKKYPLAHITWVTAPESAELLQPLPEIDRLLPLELASVLELESRNFELAICLDKDPWALGMIKRVHAAEKKGWGLAPDGVGTPQALNPEAEYSLALGVFDDLKFRQNQKSYLQIIFEALGLTYQGEPYLFRLLPEDQSRSRDFFQKNQLAPETPVVGFFTGCGPAFQNKRWTEAGFASLAEKVSQELKARVLLMAGPQEQAINQSIRQQARVPLLDTHGEHTTRQLAGFLAACSAVVTGDTLALHLALALGKPTVALFGPTCAQEIEMFGQGEKVISPLECVPCYQQTCDQRPSCMEAILVDTVWQALFKIWRKTR